MLIRMLQAHHPYGRTNVCWMPGDVVSVPRDLGNMLVNHWHAEPVPGEDKQDDWDYLRNYVGERPATLARSSRLVTICRSPGPGTRYC